MPRQTRCAWLSRASGSRRANARISAIACSDTARAFTPAALARRTPRAASCVLSNWSVPEPIDWMNRSLVANGISPLCHMPETTITSASGARRSNASRSRTSKLAIAVFSASKQAFI